MSLDVTLIETRPVEVYAANITHNLNSMAEAAGLYQYLWRPEEVAIRYAAELIVPLHEGLARLKSNPEKFRSLNPSNGWGTYDDLIRFVEQYLEACIAHPMSRVSISR